MRKSKDDLYLDVAESLLGRATCMRRVYGVVIVKNDEIISTGYNGAPRGRKNCTSLNYCKRVALHVPSGERYELCRSVHAESNAIISAQRRDTIDSTLYLVGKDAMSKQLLDVCEPCSMCKRMIINAGIKDVVVRTSSGIKTYLVNEYVKDDDSL